MMLKQRDPRENPTPLLHREPSRALGVTAILLAGVINGAPHAAAFDDAPLYYTYPTRLRAEVTCLYESPSELLIGTADGVLSGDRRILRGRRIEALLRWRDSVFACAGASVYKRSQGAFAPLLQLPAEIVGAAVFKDSLYIATREGLFLASDARRVQKILTADLLDLTAGPSHLLALAGTRLYYFDGDQFLAVDLPAPAAGKGAASGSSYFFASAAGEIYEAAAGSPLPPRRAVARYNASQRTLVEGARLILAAGRTYTIPNDKVKFDARGVRYAFGLREGALIGDGEGRLILALPTHRVLALEGDVFVDALGNTWRNTAAGDLRLMDPELKEQTVNIQSRLPKLRVTAEYFDPESSLWAGIRDEDSTLGLLYYEKTQWTLFDTENSSLKTLDIRSLRGGGGRIAALTTVGIEIYDIPRKRWSSLDLPPGMDPETVLQAVPGEDGDVFLLSTQRLFRWNGSDWGEIDTRKIRNQGFLDCVVEGGRAYLATDRGIWDVEASGKLRFLPPDRSVLFQRSFRCDSSVAFWTADGEVFFFDSDRRAWSRYKGGPIPGYPTYIGCNDRFLYIKTEYPSLYTQIDLRPVPSSFLAVFAMEPDFASNHFFEPASPRPVAGGWPLPVAASAGLLAAGGIAARIRRRRRRAPTAHELLIDRIRAFSHSGECTRQMDRLKRLAINLRPEGDSAASFAGTKAALRLYLNGELRARLAEISKLGRRTGIQGWRDVDKTYRGLIRAAEPCFAAPRGAASSWERILPDLQRYERAVALFKASVLASVRLDLKSEAADYGRDKAGREPRLRFALASGEGEAHVYIARSDLRGVLDVLVTNSLEAAAPDRSVHVSLNIQPGVSGVSLEIRDDGPGVPPEVEARLFQKDFSTKAGLRGYGLYMAREIMKKYGGSIDYVQTQAPGAVFRIGFFKY